VDMSMDPSFEQTQMYKQHRIQALTAIKGLCRLDPGKRFDAIEALELWAPQSSVLQLPNAQAWLQSQKVLRNKLDQLRG